MSKRKPSSKVRKPLPLCAGCRKIRCLSTSGQCWNCDSKSDRGVLPGMEAVK
jgi:hypothetical protein